MPAKKRLIRLLVIYTGGTFGMSPRGVAPRDIMASFEQKPLPVIPLVPMSALELQAALPRLPSSMFGCSVELTFERFTDLLDSSSITPREWVDMAQTISDRYDNFDGFVLIHGTDTMAYSATALSFMLEGLEKPVILTGAQIPLISPDTDAKQNYCDAVRAAVAMCLKCDDGWSGDVAIAFGGRLLRGCRATKVSTVSLQAFDSPNALYLGKISKDGAVTFNETVLRPKSITGFRLRAALSLDVFDLVLFPGMSNSHLHKILSLPKLKAVVLRSFGAGNIPENKEFIDILKEAIQKLHIINISQCVEGTAGGTCYSAAFTLQEIKVIQGNDLTPEAALCKAMSLLGEDPEINKDAFACGMRADMRGEITERVDSL